MLLRDGVIVRPDMAARFAIVDKTARRARLVWTGFDILGSKAAVSVTWSINNGCLMGTIALSKLKTAVQISAIRFPIYEFAFKGECDAVVPSWQGALFPAVKSHCAQGERIGGGYLNDYNMQFMALILADGRGFYFDTRDARGFMKSFYFTKGAKPDSIRYFSDFPHPVLADGQSFSLPYKASLRIFCGNWHDAAAIYRRWALRQRWTRKAGTRENRERKEALDSIALWLWNRGAADEVIPPAFEARQRSGVPVALDWYWWHRHGYDGDYPDYLPSREGDEKFRAALACLKEAGIYTQVYINGMLLDMSVPRFRSIGLREAGKEADGTCRTTICNVYTKRPLAYICGGGKRFAPELASQTRQLRALGLPGIYLDMISSCCNKPCFDARHGHAPGNGSYQISGYRRLLQRIRRENPGMLLSSENCGEMFLDLIDLNITLDASMERIGWRLLDSECIPLFKAVYGSLPRLFGNYALIDGVPPYDPLWPDTGKWIPSQEKDWRTLCPEQFRLEIARNVIYGAQPTVANLQQCHFNDPQLRMDINFLLTAARFYHENRRFLLLGELQNPGTLNGEKQPTAFLKRMIFTRPEDAVIRTKFTQSPLHSVWEDSEGSVALFLANFRATPSCFEWTDGHTTHTGKVPPMSFVKIKLNDVSSKG
ncbi:MAG: DUF6259 domain-containing protein [Victivallaceae bacterium]|nr:DUF6259 domain-containing protein [Victivallaceae bacterium]